MIQSSPCILSRCFLLAGENGGYCTQAASKYRGGVSPEALLRVQTRGHGGLTLLEFHSLVSLLWVLTTSWSCSLPGSDSAQGSKVWPEVSWILKVRPWRVLTGGVVGAGGTHWMVGVFEWDTWACGRLFRMWALTWLTYTGSWLFSFTVWNSYLMGTEWCKIPYPTPTLWLEDLTSLSAEVIWMCLCCY